MKRLYYRTITPQALALIRHYEGDIVGHEVIVCHYTYEEPSRNRKGHVVEGAFKMFFPNQQAICYTATGEFSFVL
ncbi:hypothetical protein ccbrp13_08280 [Ktedonobacteria bacterium brp13]|nr:hypothetical protein ccbrp13_08280 [Ktedonobacteria bacterium brp13]